MSSAWAVQRVTSREDCSRASFAGMNGWRWPALPVRREVGDRAGEAVTRYNVAMIYRAQGELGRAVAELEQIVELDRQVGHPDLQSDTEMLHRVRRELAGPDAGRGP